MAYSFFISSSALTLTNMAVQNQMQPAGPALRSPSPVHWPGDTLPPALLARAETPPLRIVAPAAAVTGQRREKRAALLPPSGKGVAKKPRTTAQPHTPPASFISSVVTAAAVTTAEGRLALDKKVAGCLLARSWTGAAAAWRQEGRAALRCLCLELPRGSRRALHQDAPGRSWMEAQKGGVPPVGVDGEVRVPTAGAGDDADVFAMYARWRKNVRMPSRFYMQHVRARSTPDMED